MGQHYRSEQVNEHVSVIMFTLSFLPVTNGNTSAFKYKDIVLLTCFIFD